jgi:hypothetical protein
MKIYLDIDGVLLTSKNTKAIVDLNRDNEYDNLMSFLKSKK